MKKIGCTLSIIGALILSGSFLYLTIYFFGLGYVTSGVAFLFMLFGSLTTLGFTINYLYTDEGKSITGKLGIIFAGIIGGILILLDKDSNNNNSNNK